MSSRVKYFLQKNGCLYSLLGLTREGVVTVIILGHLFLNKTITQIFWIEMYPNNISKAFSFQERRPASGSSHSHGGRRPVKVWNANRNVRKALVVGTYDEFLRKGNVNDGKHS